MKYIRIEFKIENEGFLFTECTFIVQKDEVSYQISAITYNTKQKIVF